MKLWAQKYNRIIFSPTAALQAELYDVIHKNLEKVTNPKGEEKSSMYWSCRGEALQEQLGQILLPTINQLYVQLHESKQAKKNFHFIFTVQWLETG